MESFSLKIEVERPAKAFMPGQGRTTRLLRATVGRDVTAMVWKVIQLPPPIYYPPDTEGYQGVDFDSDGNLIVTIASEGASIRDTEINEEYQDETMFLVAANGSATQTGPHAFLMRHHPSAKNTESLGVLGRVLWALGRPWGDGLGDTVSDKALPNGLRKVRTTTDGWSFKYVAKFRSECELIVAPGDGFLVRHADLGSDAKCHSEGTRWFGNVSLAERGEFILGKAETISVRLVSFSHEFDEDLVAEAREMLGRAGTQRVQVMDYRVEDPTKRLRTVPAGGLDKDQ
jgi:hypothetical protein